MDRDGSATRSTRSRDSVVSNPSVTSTVSESAATTQQLANAPPDSSAAPAAVSSANAVDASVYERLLKDYKRLRSKVEVLEKENEDLRASLWEVSWRSKTRKAGRDSVLVPPTVSQSIALTSEDSVKLDQEGISATVSSFMPSSASAPSATSSTRDVALNREHAISLPSTREGSDSAKREYRWKRAADLSEHRGAVYSVQWSPEFLATAGMDGVRVWRCQDWQDDAPSLSTHLTHHSAPVSSLACSKDAIVSGGYDSTVMLNDIEKGEPVWNKTTDGLVQAVAWTASNQSDFAWGTTGKLLGIADRRAKHQLGEWQTDAMVNTITALESDQLLCGLSSGQTRMFDLRTMSFVPSAPVTSVTKRSPLSCLSTIAKDRFLATTSFDNFVRVYDRSSSPEPRLVHTLKTKNRHFPIKCAWYRGTSLAMEAASKGSARRRQSKSISSSLLLATGSSDPTVLVYDLTNLMTTNGGNGSGGGGGEGSSGTNKERNDKKEDAEKEEIKCARLEGHKDAVYAVDFNRFTDTPLLASGAGDGVVKVWGVIESEQ